MTAVKVLSPRMLRSPEQVADYFLYGADYIVDVSEEMGFETDDLDERIENAYDAMSEGETDVDDEVATVVGAVLVGDAEYWKPMASWLPRGYAFLMWSFAHPMRRKLLRLAGIYTETLGDGGFSEFYNAYPSVRNGFGAPVFSRPDDSAMTVDGSEPTSHIDGFCEHAVLGDAVLHTEWYVYAAEKVGVEVDDDLVERTMDESLDYFTGRSDELSDDVRRFQRVMFSDYDWINKFHDRYNLRSVLFKRAANCIEEVAEELSTSTSV